MSCTSRMDHVRSFSGFCCLFPLSYLAKLVDEMLRAFLRKQLA
jgi:hypothetical protein